jgi:hypothetical protein
MGMSEIIVDSKLIDPKSIHSKIVYSRYGLRHNDVYACTRAGDIVQACLTVERKWLDAELKRLSEKENKKYCVTPELAIAKPETTSRPYNYPFMASVDGDATTIWQACPPIAQLDTNTQQEIVTEGNCSKLVWQDQTIPHDLSFNWVGRSLAIALLAIQGFNKNLGGEIRPHSEAPNVYELWFILCGILGFTDDERNGVLVGTTNLEVVTQNKLTIHQAGNEPVAVITDSAHGRIALVSSPHVNIPGNTHSSYAIPGAPSSRMVAIKTK